MKRTVLYYPTISIPDNWWLRQAVFYFDEVASIVPQTMTWGGESLGQLVPLTPELEFLQQEGVFRAISPELLTLGRTWDEAQQLQEDLRAILATARHRAQCSDEYVHVHRGKTNESILGVLRSEGLIKDAESTPFKGEAREWMLVEKNTALLYLSLLAKYLSAIEEEATVPGTDRQEYRDLVYGTNQEKEGETGVQLHLQKILPVPKPGTDIHKIVAFKRKRHDELLQFRHSIDDLEDKLAKSQDQEEVRHNLIRFAEKQQMQVSNLSAALVDARIETVFGSMKALVKSNSPAFWTSLLATIGGIAAGAPVISIPAIIVGGVAATCEVSTFLIDRRIKARSQEKQSSITYLHYAMKEGLL
jgi:Family of unknown function (DUF6236)